MSSLSSALATARSGLDATQVWSDVTSHNIANVNSDGYVRKDVTFATQSAGAGGVVKVSDIRREVNASLDRMYRLESSKMSKAQSIYEGVQAYTSILGQPSDESSPVSKLTKLQTAFGTLANQPGTAAAQQGVVDAANTLVGSLHDASDALNEVTSEVGSEIKYDVTDLNKTLYKIADLNKQLLGSQQHSVAGADLQDEISTQVQSMSKLMDVQISTDASGQVSVYTAGGTPLLEGQQVNDVSYNVSTGKLYSGSVEITPGSTGVRGFDNGSLAGLFELQGSILPTFRAQLDDFAKNLIQGFQSQDASLSAGQAGLFTDAGAALNLANVNGLAGRISVNAAVDPAQGGTLSRIRDGIGAATPGAAGDATQVNAFLQVFSQTTAAGAGTNLPSGMTLGDYAANMVSYQQVQGTNAQTNYNSLQTSSQTIQSSRQSVEGVNLDDELQKLIVIQHSYAANSKMMSTISQMMDDLIQAV